MSDDEVQARIDAYCARYGVKERTAAGLPVYPAGLRETEQHREWVTLYKLVDRHRKRAGGPATPKKGPAGSCPICLRPAYGSSHSRCEEAVAFLRELGADAVDRVRTLISEGQPDPTVRKRKG